jgi:site-specific recombinase XerD
MLPASVRGSQRDTQAATVAEMQPLVAFLTRPTPRQHRDRALLTLGFAACLTAKEAMALRVGDVKVESKGLLLRLQARRSPTAIPHSRNASYCPTLAWEVWRQCLEASRQAQPDDPAFPGIHYNVIRDQNLAAPNLFRIVSGHCADAGFTGDYSFTSLRIGFIRTAGRASVPDQLILRQAGLNSMHSVALHVARERLITHSVAGRLGL